MGDKNRLPLISNHRNMLVKPTNATATGGAATQTKFIGTAWEQTLKSGKSAGQKFLSLRIDRDKEVTLGPTDVIFAFPNQSARAGRKDPQYRLAVQVPA